MRGFDESVFVADINGDGRDEILRASDDGLYHQELRAYEWRNGRFRLKREGKLILGEDLQAIVAVVRLPSAGERFIVLLTHNRGDAGQTLRFYLLNRFLKDKRPLDGTAIDTNLFSVAYLGSATLDLVGSGTEALLVSLEAQAADFSRQPSPTVSRLQAYRYSPMTKSFELLREWRDPPTALHRLFGGMKRSHETLLAGMEKNHLVLCRWDGKSFTTQDTGKEIRGEPRAFVDLSGNGRYRVIALEESGSVWVSGAMILKPL